jgi:hypothetical protein
MSAMIATDTVSITFICQICMQLKIIEDKLKNIDNNNDIISIIKMHIKILKYGDDVCEELSTSILSQYVTMFFIICFSTFTAQTVSNFFANVTDFIFLTSD